MSVLLGKTLGKDLKKSEQIAQGDLWVIHAYFVHTIPCLTLHPEDSQYGSARLQSLGVSVCKIVPAHVGSTSHDQSPVAETSAGHWSSVGCQVLSGLYRSMFLTILRESGPRSFS
jgi:hypothetical protein